MSEKKSIEEILSQNLADAVFDVNTPAQSSQGMFELPSFDDLAQITKPKDIPEVKERNILRGLGEFGSQFAQRGTETATLGISKFIVGEAEDPETLGGKIGMTLGTVAGFMAPMSLFGMGARAGTRAFSKFSGTKLANTLREGSKSLIQKNTRVASKTRETINPMTDNEAGELFFKEVVEKKLLKPLENFGSSRTFKTVADKNKFVEDTMTYSGRFLEQRAKDLGLKIGKINPKTGKNDVLEEITNLYRNEFDKIGGRPVTEWRQQIMKAVSFGGEGKIASGVSLAVEEGIAFAAVEGGMHVTNVMGGFHQHDGTEARWDELDDVLGQAFVLGNILGVGRLIPGGVKGGAIPNLLTKSGRDQGRAIFGYLPKFVNKYQPTGMDIAAKTDRASLYTMYRHFDKLGVGNTKISTKFIDGFNNHPLRDVLKTGDKSFVPTRANIREMLTTGTQKQQDALGIILKDNLQNVGNFMHKEWKPQFLTLLRKDLVGSQLRMGYGGMVLGGGPQVLFDENILFEDKLIGFLTGYLLFKHGKELNYKQPGKQFGDAEMWGSWSGMKPEYGEMRQQLSQQADMWSALGVDFGEGPWSSVIAASRKAEPFGAQYDIDASTISGTRILETLNPVLINRGESSKGTKADWNKIVKDKNYEEVRNVHEHVIQNLENNRYIKDEQKVLPLTEMTYSQYKDLANNYKENGWKDGWDLKNTIVEAKVNNFFEISLNEVQSLLNIFGLFKNTQGERYAKPIEKTQKGAPVTDSKGEYQYSEVRYLKIAEDAKLSDREVIAIDWMNKHVASQEAITASMIGGSKIRQNGELTIRKGENLEPIIQQIELVKSNFEKNYSKNLEVENDRQILYNGDVLERVNTDFRYVLELKRLTNFWENISNQNRERTPREKETITLLKDIFAVTDKQNRALDLYHGNKGEFTGYNKLSKKEQAFFDTILPMVGRLGSTTEYGKVGKYQKKPIDKNRVKLAMEVFQAEGFSFPSDTIRAPKFAEDLINYQARIEAKNMKLPDGKGGVRDATQNDIAIISKVTRSPLVKNKKTKMLRESYNIFDTLDVFPNQTWQQIVNSKKYADLSSADRTNLITFKESLDANGIKWDQKNALNEFLQPYIIGQVGRKRTGFWRKSESESAILSPLEYTEMIQTLNFLKNQQIKEVTYPMFFKDLNDIAKNEKHQFTSAAQQIHKLLAKESPQGQLHIYTLLKQNKMLNENNMFGLSRDLKIDKDPETSMENQLMLLKQQFGTRTEVQGKDVEALSNQKLEDGNIMADLMDNPVKSIKQIYDKYSITGDNFKIDDTLVASRAEQVKDIYISKYSQDSNGLFKFVRDLKKQIKEENEIVSESNLDMEMVSVIKSVNKGVKAYEIQVDLNKRVSNFKETSLANNQFHRLLKDILGVEELHTINESFVPVSRKKSAKTLSEKDALQVAEGLNLENFVIVDGQKIVKRRKNQSMNQLVQEIQSQNPDVNIRMLERGTFFKYVNSSGGLYVPASSFEAIAQRYVLWHKKSGLPKESLKDINIIKNDKGEYQYHDTKTAENNFRDINTMITDMLYSDLMGLKQYLNVRQSTEAKHWKELKYFVQFKNDNEFIPTEQTTNAIRQLVSSSSSTYGGRKKQLLEGLSFNETNAEIKILRDEVPAGEGYRKGDIPEAFSNRARFDKNVQENNPRLFEVDNSQVQSGMYKLIDKSSQEYKNLSKYEKDVYEILEKEIEVLDAKPDNTWADGATWEHPSLQISNAFLAGTHPRDMNLSQGVKFLGKRKDSEGGLEFVKSFSTKDRFFDDVFTTRTPNGKFVVKIETTSANKNLGGGTQRVQDNIIDLKNDFVSEVPYLSQTHPNKYIPYKASEYPILYSVETKDYGVRAADNMKHFTNGDAMNSEYTRIVTPNVRNIRNTIERKANLGSPYRDTARAWYRSESERRVATSGENIDPTTMRTGVVSRLTEHNIDPLFDTNGVRDIIHSQYVDGNMFKSKDAVKTSFTPELPGDKLDVFIGSPEKGVYQWPQMNISNLAGNKIISSEAGNSSAIVLKSRNAKDKWIILEDIVHNNGKGNKDWIDIQKEYGISKDVAKKLYDISLNDTNVTQYMKGLKEANALSPENKFELFVESERHPNQAASARVLFGVKEIHNDNAHKPSSVEGFRKMEYDFDGDTGTVFTRFSKEGLKQLEELQTIVKDAEPMEVVAERMAYKGLDFSVEGNLARTELESRTAGFIGVLMQFPQIVQKIRFSENDNPILKMNGYDGAYIRISRNRYLASKSNRRNPEDLSAEIALQKEIKKLGQAALDRSGSSIDVEVFRNKESLLEYLLLQGEGKVFEEVIVDWKTKKVHPTGGKPHKDSRARYLLHSMIQPISRLLTAEKTDYTNNVEKSAGPYSIVKAVDKYNMDMRFLERNVVNIKDKKHPLYEDMKSLRGDVDSKFKGDVSVYGGFGRNADLTNAFSNPESYVPRDRAVMEKYSIYKQFTDYSLQDIDSANKFYPEYASVLKTDITEYSASLLYKVKNEKDMRRLLDSTTYLKKQLREAENELNSFLPIKDSKESIKVSIEKDIAIESIDWNTKKGLEKNINRLKSAIAKNERYARSKWGDLNVAKQNIKASEQHVRQYYLPNKIKEMAKSDKKFDKKAQDAWVKKEAKNPRISTPQDVNTFVFEQANRQFATTMHEHTQRRLNMTTFESKEFDTLVRDVKNSWKEGNFSFISQKGEWNAEQRSLAKQDYFDRIDAIIKDRTPLEIEHILAKIMSPDSNIYELQQFRGQYFPSVGEKGYNSRLYATLEYIGERLSLTHPDLARRMDKNYANAFNEITSHLLGTEGSSLFTKTMGQEIYDAGNELYAVNVTPITHSTAEFFKAYGSKGTENLYQTLSRMSQYEAIQYLYGGRVFSDLINSNKILNSPIGKINERGEWVKPYQQADNIKAQIISDNTNNVISNAMPISSSPPAPKNKNFSNGADYFKGWAAKTLKDCMEK